ncbi:RNA polymerase sigma factor [Mucilaginibacter phyllosphaerae]|uniref:RNA polymerase sigma factor (Sigma-70 family) n=1 Tax=Mucilaginibacter phyllosphaerae TaxID=1812349 RepID=A0A4Y8A7U8_9SPHI|nr:sigma-70 family RNA polymerase sigma factor [Mucilaginibacter phyllosphaerae]MBB3971145.1 RNA polymerase sigma factor (sigma-70 family) [Mucilaginibacter phyllosphaerae]TEW63871.1 sigma-70 family RNA polymerase sigma factor [Mucilaginibacter phyllosphaerae]GGH22738.1 DNA-directed RNA polymerase sigma-70 factor [Mucilaginibacter phyllosphaerae]
MPKTEETLSLWNLFKQGDWEAYTEIYNQNFKILNNYGHKFTRDVNLIEDAVHDLFIKLWTNKDNLATPVSVKNYLYKALRNIIFRKMQSQSRFTEIEDEYPFSFEVSFDDIVISNEKEKELQDKIKSVIKTLPPRQQEIIYLRFYEGFNYPEIAEIMNINASSTYKLLYKALNNMEVALKASKLAIIWVLFCEFHQNHKIL